MYSTVRVCKLTSTCENLLYEYNENYCSYKIKSLLRKNIFSSNKRCTFTNIYGIFIHIFIHTQNGASTIHNVRIRGGKILNLFFVLHYKYAQNKNSCLSKFRYVSCFYFKINFVFIINKCIYRSKATKKLDAKLFHKYLYEF